MNTGLYRRRAANINSRMGNRSTQPCSYVKQFKEKLQNYNGEIDIPFVDGKNSCALDHKTPWSLFLSRKVTLPSGAKSHIKNVLGLALYFYYLFDTNSTYVLNWAFLNTLELEIRESQDLVKDFRRTARGWKGNKAIRKKIYKFKKLKQYKEIKQNYNNQKED